MRDTPVADIRKMYRQAKELEKAMQNVGDSDEAKEDYYRMQGSLKVLLGQILRTNFLHLSKPALVKFLVMCNSHRPVEPVWILTGLSMLAKDYDGA